jgi:subtilisin family serine protease
MRMRTNRVLALMSIAMAVLMVASTFGGVVGDDGEKAEKVIVLFKDTIDEDLVTAKGGKIDQKFSLIPAVVTNLKANDIKALKKNDKVKAVEPAGTISIAKKPDNPGGGKDKDNGKPQPAEVMPWGVDRIDADLAWDDTTGTDIKVAVLDTGIEEDHPDLKENILGGENFIPSKKGTVDPNKWGDDNGHGTHCAGTIAGKDNEIGVIGVAPNAGLYAGKVLDRRGNGQWPYLIAAIEWAVSIPVDVISMSLSGGYSQGAKDACDAAMAAGVVLVAAAGNSNPAGSVRYPAAFDSVIAVGATDSSDDRASWSCYGNALELMGPGVDVLSTWKGSGYNTISGTSMACPHVAGTVALILEDFPSMTVAQVRTLLQNTAEDLGDPGWDSLYGHGLVDAEAAYNAA